MAQDLERLTVSLEARIKSFEREMQRARGVTDRQMKAIEGRTSAASTRINKLMASTAQSVNSSLAALGVGGLLTGGVVGAFESIRRAVGDLANTSAEAKRAGLGVEQFQELQFAAMQSRVSVDSLVDGMKELALRGDEFVTTGAGSGAEAFQRLGYSAEELNRKLQDPPKLLEEIIEKMRDLDKSAQIRIADEVFGGTGGEQFVRFLDQGANAIARARKEARETGNVLSDEVIKKAEAVDKAFNTWAMTLSTNVKASLLGIIPLMQDVANAVSKYQASLGKTDMTGAEFQRTSRIQQLQGLLNRNPNTSAARSWRQELDELTELQRQAARMGRPAPTAAAPAAPAPAVPSSGTGKGDLSNIKKPGESASEILKGYAAIEQAAKARIEALRTEQQAIGLTTAAAEKLRFEQDLLAEATRDGTTLTQAQKDRITELATQYGTLSAAIEDAADAHAANQQRMEDFQSLAKDSLGSFISDLRQGKDAAEALGNTLDRIADRMIDMALNSLFDSKGGGLGGMIGSLFGGARAMGGPVQSGKTYLVGENGPELATFGKNGTIIPNHALPKMGSGGGGGVVIHNYSGAPVTTREVPGPRGPRTEVLIGDAIKRAGHSGELDSMMKQRFGLSPMRGR